MTILGYHASHELFSPRELLDQLRAAEQAGFQCGMCSDHFHPWTPDQGHSGYSFAWLGAALQATRLPLGTICCPIGRYHPAVVAQAGATLAHLFPQRFWLALGTGQALNEHITGEPWPSKAERQDRVRGAADVIRALWAGELVDRAFPLVVRQARLYSLPSEPPRLFGAAITPSTAKWVAGWADGLLTAAADPSTLTEVVDSFRNHGGEGKPMILQSMVGYHPDESVAWANAIRNWPIAVLSQEVLQNTSTPEELATLSRAAGPNDLKGKLRVSADLSRHREWLVNDLALGFDQIHLFSISGDPMSFIDAYGEHVLPHVRHSVN